MMLFNREQLEQLLNVRRDPCVSVFLPTHRAGPEREQDRIRLKNLVVHVRRELADQGTSRKIADELLKPLEDLRDNSHLWDERSDGLAIFRAPDFFHLYTLPEKFDETVIVSNRFHIKPLLPLLFTGRRFYVLALTQQSARLYEATRYSLREVELPEIEQAPIDGDEQTLQYHGHRDPSQGKGATSEAVYHGQGGPSDREKKDVLNYFHRVNEAVTHVLRGEAAPLILASVGYLASLYENANSYRHLLRAKLPGNPDSWKRNELRERAWSIVEPYFRGEQDDARRAYEGARATPQTTEDLREVVLAAAEGRVESLLLASREEHWGHVDTQQQAVFIAGGVDEPDANASFEDLLDYAAAETLAHGGSVFALEDRPVSDSPVAAVFRY
jgi:hypothetical protein